MTQNLIGETASTTPPSEPGDAARGGRARALGDLWSRYRTVVVPVAALVLLVLYFQSQTPAFVSQDSAQNIMRQMAFLTVLALAGTFVILIGGIDLSVAANATLAGILIATWIDDFGGVL